jgi:hypothetical protein
MKIRISATIMDDLAVRCPDEDGCWRGIYRPGVHEVSDQQAREIAGDCDYQGNISGDYIDPISPGVTRAYRALYAQIAKGGIAA